MRLRQRSTAPSSSRLTARWIPTTYSYLIAHPSDTRITIGGRASAADYTASLAIAGADAPATSAMVAEHFFPAPPVIGIATDGAYPDALAGGANVGERGGPILLVPTVPPLPDSVNTYLVAHHASITTGYVYGGTAAVSDPTLSSVQGAIS